jgi:hypothetical protein
MMNDISNRRNFFEAFAKERGFDPYDPEHWYLQARKNIIAVEVSLPSPPLPSFFCSLSSLCSISFSPSPSSLSPLVLLSLMN